MKDTNDLTAATLFLPGILLSMLLGAYLHHKDLQYQGRLSIENTVARESWVQNVLETRYKVPYPDSALLANTIILASEREKFPVEWTMAIINRETHYRSRTNPDSMSCGFMQVKPLWDDLLPYKRCDKYQNVFAGLWVLGHYSDKLGSNTAALEAYRVGITSYLAGDDKHESWEYRQSVLAEVDVLEEIQLVKVDTE